MLISLSTLAGCWDPCQISEQLDNSNSWSCAFEILWDLTIRCLMRYWISPLVSWQHRQLWYDTANNSAILGKVGPRSVIKMTKDIHISLPHEQTLGFLCWVFLRKLICIITGSYQFQIEICMLSCFLESDQESPATSPVKKPSGAAAVKPAAGDSALLRLAAKNAGQGTLPKTVKLGRFCSLCCLW